MALRELLPRLRVHAIHRHRRARVNDGRVLALLDVEPEVQLGEVTQGRARAGELELAAVVLCVARRVAWMREQERLHEHRQSEWNNDSDEMQRTCKSLESA